MRQAETPSRSGSGPRSTTAFSAACRSIPAARAAASRLIPSSTLASPSSRDATRPPASSRAERRSSAASTSVRIGTAAPVPASRSAAVERTTGARRPPFTDESGFHRAGMSHGAWVRASSAPVGPDHPLPAGLRYSEGLIPPDGESALVRRFAGLPLAAFRFHGHLGRRRVVSYGWRFDFDAEEPRRTDPVPPFLLPLREAAAAFAGLTPA